MARKIDREVLLGFVDEARGYLPRIREGIDQAAAGGGDLGALEEIHRRLHTLKGAASMVGLSPLSHIAYYAEEAVEQIGAEQLPMDRRAAAVLRETAEHIERYLDGVVSGKLREQPLVAAVVRSYRRLRGEPTSGDEEEIGRLIAAESPAVGGDSVAGADPAVLELRESDALGDEVSPELMDAFLQEAEDHLHSVSSGLREVERQPGDLSALQAVRRSVHTLKGAASMVGLAAVSRLAHRMEDLLDHLFEGTVALSAENLELLFATSDVLTDLAAETDPERLRKIMTELYHRYVTVLGEESGDGGVTRRGGSLVAGSPAAEPLGEEQALDLEAMPLPDAPSSVLPAVAAAGGAGSAAAGRPQSQIVRLPIERLDELVRLVSELVVNRSTFEQHLADLVRERGELRLSSERLRRVSTRLESEYEVLALADTQVPAAWVAGVAQMPAAPIAAAGSLAPPAAFAPRPTFDDLELDRYTEFHLLSRALAETSADITAVGGEMDGTIGDFESYLNQLARLTSETQDKLMRLRMVPVAQLASRFHRTVRVTARQQGKQIDLILEGEQTEVDKTILEQISDPLLHLLRNAVDHGIEPSSLRQVLGKPERGAIRLRAFHEGTQVVLQVVDDGAGLDPELLRSAAVAGGYFSEEDAAALTGGELRSLIFTPGFSTAHEVSEISGRGVGLDVVRANISKIKGTLSVDSHPGQGVTFTIRLPMTLAILRVLLVRAGGETLAVPLAAVTKIVRRQRSEIESLGREPVIRVDDEVHPALRLSSVLGIEGSTEVARRVPVLILGLGDRRIALIVDRIVEAREVVVKTLGSLLRRIQGVSGATLMGDGRVVLILNPSDLVQGQQGGDTSSEQALRGLATRMAAGRQPAVLDVMIVDDSVSVRRVLTNLAHNAGWNPIVARDGLEALEILQRSAETPDVILLDLEMPRMDGFELCSTLRSQERFRHLPIIVVTSRAGHKHRQRALELGATEYLVKPYQDETLLSVIRRLARESATRTSTA